MGLSLTQQSVGRYVTIGMAGDLDVTTSQMFRDTVAALIESGHRDLMADLDGLDFVDSAGLGVLVGAMKRVQDHAGSFAVICDSPRTLHVLKLSGLDKALPVHSSITSIVDVDNTQS